MTNDQYEHIKIAFDAMTNGDAMPSIRGPAFRVLMSAVDALTRPTDGQHSQLQAANQRALGIHAVQLLHAQMRATMHAERELALMRQQTRPS